MWHGGIVLSEASESTQLQTPGVTLALAGKNLHESGGLWATKKKKKKKTFRPLREILMAGKKCFDVILRHLPIVSPRPLT